MTEQTRVASLNISELDPEQAEAATAPRGPVSIIAGAGTGKTRTITHRIAHLVDGRFVNPDAVLAVTFTKRAAAELRERLTMMGVARVQAQTFHAAALRQLRYFWPKYAGDMQWRLMDSKFPVMASAARALGIRTDKTTLKDLIGEVEWAKSSLIVAEDYPGRMEIDRRDCPVEPQQFVDVYKKYEEIKTSSGGVLLDFDDLLLHMAAALESNVDISEEFRGQYRSFVVDEYQDVTPLQQRLLDAWLGPRDDITVVGDANQTIYSFNGATPDFLLDFSRRFPESVTVRLHRDYRSTPQVVGLANGVIEKAQGRVAGSKLKLEGQRPKGPEPSFEEYSDDTSEAADIARRIGDLIAQGVAPAEIAVLYRINAQSEAIEHALDEAGIGYQVRGGDGFFQRQEIRDGLHSLVRTAVQVDPEPQDLIATVKVALQRVGYEPVEPSGAQERQRWQSLHALVNLAEEIQSTNPQLRLRGLLSLLKERQNAKNPPRVQGVTLASIHAAKGLEWDAVFLIGLNDGMLPIQYALKGASSANAIEEERRLLYVGVTRAREHLHLSWAAAKQPGGKATRRRTRFLDGLVPEELESPGGRSPHARGRGSVVGAPKDACLICGARLTTPELKILQRCGEHALDDDHEVVKELRGWRLSAAQSLGVPAYVVLTDATLRALAQALPESPEELVRIPGIGPVKVQQFGEDILAITSR